MTPAPPSLLGHLSLLLDWFFERTINQILRPSRASISPMQDVSLPRVVDPASFNDRLFSRSGSCENTSSSPYMYPPRPPSPLVTTALPVFHAEEATSFYGLLQGSLEITSLEVLDASLERSESRSLLGS